jgi:hypothetical protein
MRLSLRWSGTSLRRLPVLVRRFLRWYGAGPLHLLTLAGCFALAGYAAAELLPNNAVGIPVWFVGAVIGHDLLLMPLYTLADMSVIGVFRHRPMKSPAVLWINYLRVPAALSGLLLLIWFPLIFRLPARFPDTTTLPLDPYLWHWLGVTGALFLLSAVALALRLGTVRRGMRKGPTSGRGDAGPPSDVTPDQPRQPGPAGPTRAGKKSALGDAQMVKSVDPSALPGPTTASGRSPEMTSPSTITERVAEMRVGVAAEPTGEAAGAFAREQAELAAAGVSAGVAPAGTVLPDAKLLDAHGAGLRGVSRDLRAALHELGQEHDALRDAIRALAEKEILPHAADVDEREVTGWPEDSLAGAGSHAPGDWREGRRHSPRRVGLDDQVREGNPAVPSRAMEVVPTVMSV